MLIGSVKFRGNVFAPKSHEIKHIYKTLSTNLKPSGVHFIEFYPESLCSQREHHRTRFQSYVLEGPGFPLSPRSHEVLNPTKSSGRLAYACFLYSWCWEPMVPIHRQRVHRGLTAALFLEFLFSRVPFWEYRVGSSRWWLGKIGPEAHWAN